MFRLNTSAYQSKLSQARVSAQAQAAAARVERTWVQLLVNKNVITELAIALHRFPILRPEVLAVLGCRVSDQVQWTSPPGLAPY